jgi:hypothetical protein
MLMIVVPPISRFEPDFRRAKPGPPDKTKTPRKPSAVTRSRGLRPDRASTTCRRL